MTDIGAGQIQGAEAGEDIGLRILDIVAEDGSDYRIDLSANGGVEAIENRSTGDWIIKYARRVLKDYGWKLSRTSLPVTGL